MSHSSQPEPPGVPNVPNLPTSHETKPDTRGLTDLNTYNAFDEVISHDTNTITIVEQKVTTI